MRPENPPGCTVAVEPIGASRVGRRRRRVAPERQRVLPVTAPAATQGPGPSGTAGSAPPWTCYPRRPFQPEIYGDRWAPVLIAWSDPTESPRLADRVAGLGGSTAYPVSDSESVYVTGAVTLDGPQFAEILNGGDGFGSARAVLLHELGHLIGLSHVDDVQQLMHDENSAGQTRFAAGDLSGIAALRSAARCHAAL